MNGPGKRNQSIRAGSGGKAGNSAPQCELSDEDLAAIAGGRLLTGCQPLTLPMAIVRISFGK